MVRKTIQSICSLSITDMRHTNDGIQLTQPHHSIIYKPIPSFRFQLIPSLSFRLLSFSFRLILLDNSIELLKSVLPQSFLAFKPTIQDNLCRAISNNVQNTAQIKNKRIKNSVQYTVHVHVHTVYTTHAHTQCVSAQKHLSCFIKLK